MTPLAAWMLDVRPSDDHAGMTDASMYDPAMEALSMAMDGSGMTDIDGTTQLDDASGNIHRMHRHGFRSFLLHDRVLRRLFPQGRPNRLCLL